MKKRITCRECNGTGKEEIEFCDICGEEESVGKYEDKMICQECWIEHLTDEEINNLI